MTIPVDRLVIEAAERVLKMGYPNDLTQEERLKRYSEDAALCASYLLAQFARGSS